ncbi:hypothetical protein GCM10011591_36900 [Nocardia camponoti]|uniref:Uncharacterized protein n=1 Tax=Nocardia camponoti TaxID=1616106 RepID=A0A917QNH7_9NOCA|nr:hypothetical protein GCM10011591_36900 [Nocardia camponoti]
MLVADNLFRALELHLIPGIGPNRATRSNRVIRSSSHGTHRNLPSTASQPNLSTANTRATVRRPCLTARPVDQSARRASAKAAAPQCFSS